MVLAFQCHKVMINLHWLSFVYYQEGMYRDNVTVSMQEGTHALTILQTGRRSRAVKVFEEEWHQLQKAQE